MLKLLENFINSCSKKSRNGREASECVNRRHDFGKRPNRSVNQTKMISTILYFLLHWTISG